MRGDLYKGKETFPHCQSLALRERWHFACEMTERVRHGRCRGFLVGAGVSASRAAKKAPPGLFCPAGRKRRAAAVRIHPRGCDFGFLQKKKTGVFSTLVFLVGAGVSASRAAAVRIHPQGCDFGFLQKKKTGVFSTLVFLVGAGVSASRAAKKAPLGLFCPAGRKRRAAAVRIHPRGCDFGFFTKEKNQRIFYAGLFGGRGWIRTSRTLSCGFLPALNPMVSCRFSDSHQNGRCIHTHSGAHKSGSQSGLNCERLQRVRHCQRSGCVLPLHGVTVPPKRVHALAVAHHAAQLCWRKSVGHHAHKGVAQLV